jgi:adenylyltransferase/sulfurtransferase
MEGPGPDQRYSRQVLLPGVGEEGQKKWSQATVLLAGESTAFESALTALSTSGVNKFYILSQVIFDPSSFVSQNPDLQIQALDPSIERAPSASLYLVVTEHSSFRRKMSRLARRQNQAALYAWPLGSGFGVFYSKHQGGKCPCLECFETLNPKSFNNAEKAVQRVLGAAAASEALKILLGEGSPLENKVGVTSMKSGFSFRHDVSPSYKCPVHLMDEGAVITP